MKIIDAYTKNVFEAEGYLYISCYGEINNNMI